MNVRNGVTHLLSALDSITYSRRQKPTSSISLQVNIRAEQYLKSESEMYEVQFADVISTWKLRNCHLFSISSKMNIER